MSDFPVEVSFPVHWAELDAFGHVNNARYFTWFETARMELFQRIGLATAGMPEIGPILAQPDPDHLSAVAPDIEHQTVGRLILEQRQAALQHQPRLLGTAYRFNGQAGLLRDPRQELLAILGLPAGFRSDAAHTSDGAAADLAGADPERVDGPLHGLGRQPPGMAQPLAQPDDAGKGVDNAESAIGIGSCYQEPAIVGAKIKRGICRFGKIPLLPARPVGTPASVQAGRHDRRASCSMPRAPSQLLPIF